MKEERDKWSREFALKYAEKQTTDVASAQRIAEQFAIGILVYENSKTKERKKFFIPPNCRSTMGRSPENSIVIDETALSQRHCSFDADEKDVYVVDFQGVSGVFVGNSRVHGKYKLSSNDIVQIGRGSESFGLRFYQLDGARK
jgi:pSer/pThr/pTyr-binding forkhead associated (FHA) protein